MVLGVMEGASRGGYFLDSIFDPSVIDTNEEFTFTIVYKIKIRNKTSLVEETLDCYEDNKMENNGHNGQNIYGFIIHDGNICCLSFRATFHNALFRGMTKQQFL